jgi:hypothetical protein
MVVPLPGHERAVETFFPADDLAAERMRSMAANMK